MTMKKRFYLTGALVLLLALVASVALVSADQPAASPAAQAAGTLEGPRWVLVSYAGQDGKTIQAIPGTETTAQFANGTVSGSAGCNRYNAPYTVDGNKIQIGLGMSTMMACPPPIMDQEAAYLANLQAAASYKIAGDQLTLANAKGSTVLTFKAEIPISLTDGVWVMTLYNNGKQAVVGALADTEVTAVFGADGQLSGSAGCNTLQRAVHGRRQQDQDRPGNLHHDGVRAADHGSGGAVPGRHPAGRHLQHPGHAAGAARAPTTRSWPAIPISPRAPPRWSAPPG